MKVYTLKRTEAEPRYGFSIDPGLKSSGFCLVDRREGAVRAWTAPKNNRAVMGVSFPNLYLVLSERVDFYLAQLPEGVDPEDTEFIVEHSYFGGEFSTGIAALVAALARAALREWRVPRLTMVPCQIPQYFLRVRSASDGEVKKFVKEKFPKAIFGPDLPHCKALSPHSADALLFQAYLDVGFFRSAFGADLREPSLERIYYKDQKHYGLQIPDRRDGGRKKPDGRRGGDAGRTVQG